MPEITDTAIPILPSRSVTDTLAFFERLGFEGKIWGEPYSYAILRRGTVELHFFTQKDLRPAESSAGCYIRVSDVENMFQAFASAKLHTSQISARFLKNHSRNCTT